MTECEQMYTSKATCYCTQLSE